MTANEYLVLASTFHSIHAIATRISPVPGSSGVESIEAESFKLTCLQSPTGQQQSLPSLQRHLLTLYDDAGTKFILFTTPSHPAPDQLLRKVYECYADQLKDPFYTTEMPIRSELFDKRMAAVIAKAP